ncbi:hypothetical protein CPB83DRAFT_908573 [Crepidotus variabilis]|uniref:Heat shock 70 kDa protein 12A n=1 Tax=Crepidotus variabilis TaxID=179855 RepID=A0A9P6EBU9_9AGAR|nr:hypothetical protein CPB83DRAFT_908573 [Crepidotus variabilis]
MSGDGRAALSVSRRVPYGGTRRKLILAFDVGTTFSGISYSILDPGQIPTIKGVTQFPAQEATSGACKIPTIIYYDEQGRVKAVGAEATQDGVYDTAQEENWTKAEWFKLHLRSKFGSSGDLSALIPPLPVGKTVVDVFADLLFYLLQCTSAYIEDTDPNGRALWHDFTSATSSPNTSSNDGIHFILSHPNGWEGKEQVQMREAAVKAGLIPDNPEAQHRITFVTEGEASLHFAVHSGLLSHISGDEGVIVVDAGGGTIDVSTYSRRGEQAFEETAIPQCYFHGSVFVTTAAKGFLQETLSESPFIDDLDHITSCFDKTTKLRFRNDQEPQYIKFGGSRDNDAHANIRFGQMKIEGVDVAKFFQAPINCVVKVVLEQKQKSPKTIRHVVLVGGFAASAWFFRKVKDVLFERGVTVIRPENNVVKAVSDGAVSFYLDHFVRTRVAKVTYGIKKNTVFDPSDPEHQTRSTQMYVDKEGTRRLKGAFAAILIKGTQVEEEEKFSQSFHRSFEQPMDSASIDTSLRCYRGDNSTPKWLDSDSNNFNIVCTLHAVVPTQRCVNNFGKTYYKASYSIVLLFGLTELKAYTQWKENGVLKTSPVQIIYD